MWATTWARQTKFEQCENENAADSHVGGVSLIFLMILLISRHLATRYRYCTALNYCTAFSAPRPKTKTPPTFESAAFL
jgi:hypothetical protein